MQQHDLLVALGPDVRTACSISPSVAMPGRDHHGPPLARRRSSRSGRLVTSIEAILMKGTSSRPAGRPPRARTRSSRRRCLARGTSACASDVLLGRELVGAHHLAQRAEVLLLVGVVGIALVLLARDERRLAPRLELDRVGAGVGGRVDQPAAQVHVAVVVGADLGDDVGTAVRRRRRRPPARCPSLLPLFGRPQVPQRRVRDARPPEQRSTQRVERGHVAVEDCRPARRPGPRTYRPLRPRPQGPRGARAARPSGRMRGPAGSAAATRSVSSATCAAGNGPRTRAMLAPCCR